MRSLSKKSDPSTEPSAAMFVKTVEPSADGVQVAPLSTDFQSWTSENEKKQSCAA